MNSIYAQLRTYEKNPFQASAWNRYAAAIYAANVQVTSDAEQKRVQDDILNYICYLGQFRPGQSPLTRDDLVTPVEPSKAPDAYEKIRAIYAKIGINLAFIGIVERPVTNGMLSFQSPYSKSALVLIDRPVLEALSDEEITTLFAHEAGHGVLQQIPRFINGMASNTKYATYRPLANIVACGLAGALFAKIHYTAESIMYLGLIIAICLGQFVIAQKINRELTAIQEEPCDDIAKKFHEKLGLSEADARAKVADTLTKLFNELKKEGDIRETALLHEATRAHTGVLTYREAVTAAGHTPAVQSYLFDFDINTWVRSSHPTTEVEHAGLLSRIRRLQ